MLNTLLNVIPLLDENHLLGASSLGEACQVEECGLGKLFDGDITKPDKELRSLLVINTWEAPASL